MKGTVVNAPALGIRLVNGMRPRSVTTFPAYPTTSQVTASTPGMWGALGTLPS